MTRTRRFTWMAVSLVLALVALSTGPQAQTTTRDLEMLDEQLSDLQQRVNRERRSGSRDVTAVQREVDSLANELTYLQVKRQKEGALERGEVGALRAQIEDLSVRLDDGEWGMPPSGAAGRSGESDRTRDASSDAVVSVGTEIDVRLQTSLDSDRAVVEDPVRATTVEDLAVDGILIPAGSEVRGVVTAVDRSSRTDRTSSLTIMFDEMRIDGMTYPATLSVVEALESGGFRDDAGRAGVGAGVGGVIGGLLGGVKGALAGILIGAGGTVMATEGEDVVLPAGTLLRLRFDTPLTLR